MNPQHRSGHSWTNKTKMMCEMSSGFKPYPDALTMPFPTSTLNYFPTIANPGNTTQMKKNVSVRTWRGMFLRWNRDVSAKRLKTQSNAHFSTHYFLMSSHTTGLDHVITTHVCHCWWSIQVSRDAAPGYKTETWLEQQKEDEVRNLNKTLKDQAEN